MKASARAVVCAVILLRVTAASGQSVVVDYDQGAGYSTEDVTAAQAKLRAAGDVTHDIRFDISSAWGRQSEESGAFGAAYPYTNRPVVLDAFVERMFRPGEQLLGFRAGRYRTPFGISSESDQGYVGFQRDPLIRYSDFYALSNTFFEHGADVIVGSPRVSVEASVGTPGDVGEHTRPRGFDRVFRGQTAFGSFIFGASYIQTSPHLGIEDDDPGVGPGDAGFGGLDARWMRAGVQLRGEIIAGHPFDGATTRGGYVDLIVHRSEMGPVTTLFRAERIHYVGGPDSQLQGERQTAAARVRLVYGFVAQFEVVHNSQTLPSRRPTAVDLGISYSLRLK